VRNLFVAKKTVWYGNYIFCQVSTYLFGLRFRLRVQWGMSWFIYVLTQWYTLQFNYQWL